MTSPLLRISTLVPIFMANPWSPTKQQAVRQIVDWRLKRDMAQGHGNEASRRAAQIEAATWFEDVSTLTEDDLNAIAEDHERNTEGRTYRRTFAVNPHDA